MKIENKLNAFIRNIDAHKRGDSDLSPHQICEMLDDLGSRWRIIWEELPRDMLFDQLYTSRERVPDEAPRPFLYRQKPADVRSHAIIAFMPSLGPNVDMDDKCAWFPYDTPTEIVKWLVDNPPYPELAPLAELFNYDLGIEKPFSPWVLFRALTGELERHPIDMIELTTHLPLPSGDAAVIGNALQVWGKYNDTASAYVHLLVGYDVCFESELD